MKTELIGVVKTILLLERIQSKESIFDITSELIDNIKKYAISYPRNKAEEDENYKQIVSYYICLYNNMIFINQRKTNCSEQRLKNKFSLGIGGHLSLRDISKNLENWGEREFYEEVNYIGEKKIIPFKIINDNSNPVGRVHLGISYLIKLNSNLISIKSELKNGFFIPLNQLKDYYENLEPWAQILSFKLIDLINT